jgi:hypothetical protein
MAFSAEMSQRPSRRRSLRFQRAPGEGTPRAFKSFVITRIGSPAAVRSKIPRTMIASVSMT